MLRDEVYREIDYRDEFPEPIKGLDFDEYDERSAIIYSKRNNIIEGTCRFIFDSDNKLPIDEKFSVDYLRGQNRILAEGSRVIVRNRGGLSPDFKLMMVDTYRLLSSYKIHLVSSMTEEHVKIYENFGGFTVEKKFDYGNIKKKFFITLWKMSEVSPLFKRVFLKNVDVA